MAEEDGYIELLAKMDIIATVSACTDEISPMNDKVRELVNI